MSTDIHRRVWSWVAISASGVAIAALVRVAGRWRDGSMRPRASRSSGEAAAAAALEIAGGAMSNEGGPVRNV